MKTPRTDALIEAGAESQNQYITKFIALCRQLENELQDANDWQERSELLADYKRRTEAADNEIAAFRLALDTFGQHRNHCAALAIQNGVSPCTCGFDDAKG